MTEHSEAIRTFDEYKKKYYESEMKEETVLDGKTLAQLSLDKITRIISKKSK